MNSINTFTKFIDRYMKLNLVNTFCLSHMEEKDTLLNYNIVVKHVQFKF